MQSPESSIVLAPLVGQVLFALAAAAYLVATGLFGVFLFRSSADVRTTRSGKLAPHVVAFGAVVHSAQIVVASLILHVCPVEGVHFPMSVLSVMMVLAYVVMRRRWRIDVVGAFVAPLALAALLASYFVAGKNGLNEPAPAFRALLPFHIVSNIGGVALFALAFGAASLYLVQENLLKSKQIEGLFQRLPSLDSLDRAEHRFLLAGFPLLTLGLLTGTLAVHHLETTTLGTLARIAFGYATWTLAAGVLLLRAAAGWRGRRAAYGTIAGFAFAVLVLVSYGTRPEPSAPVTAAAPTTSTGTGTGNAASATTLTEIAR